MKKKFLARVALTVLLVLSMRASAQVEIELALKDKIPLSGELEDLASFGGVKESSCDQSGNIWMPSLRKYGSAVNSILRISPDGKTYQRFLIDELPRLQKGDIVDFARDSANGDVYTLAREVTKYNDVTVPVGFGETFIVRWSREGKILSQSKLGPFPKEFVPTGLALLRNGYLVVGKEYAAADHLIVTARVYSRQGRLMKSFNLTKTPLPSSNAESAYSTRVFNPIAIAANGAIYVLRGTTVEPVYVLSEEGEVEREIRLDLPAVEFEEPQIRGNELIVRRLPSEPPKQFEFRQPGKVGLPVFDLNTGTVKVQYFWRQESLGLMCYSPTEFVFFGQTLGQLDFMLVHAVPKSSMPKTSDRAAIGGGR